MLIDKNIEILSKNKLHWIGSFEENSDNNFTEIIQDIELGLEYFQKKDGTVYIVKDEFNWDFKLNNKLKEIIIVIGINSINEIEELKQQKYKDSYIIIIEPNIQLFNYNLNNKDLSVFSDERIYLFADSDKTKLTPFINAILSQLNMTRLIKNIQVYISYFYRNFEIQVAKDFMATTRVIIRNLVDTYGNDIKDNLIGLEQNLNNLKYLNKSKNPGSLRDRLKNIPAIVVAAGPSLNKNIKALKKAQGKAVIIAVDTIVTRLLDEGITPDFVCSVERTPLVYEYFYKDKNIPQTVTLVGPSLLDSRVFETFKGELLLPFRFEVNEYRWLQYILGVEGNVGMLMGMSCAHVGFGLAHLLGCSPITLIGQDLAYGNNEGETHATGTTYDDLDKNNASSKDDEYTIGYYGNTVKTTKIWNYFKYWYESRIESLGLNVINATEGGAKINSTLQMPLEKVIEIYCLNDIPSVYDLVKESETYQLDLEKIAQSFEEEINAFEEFNSQCIKMIYYLKNIDISDESLEKHSEYILQTLTVTDALVNRLSKHQLLSHNLQSTILQYYWRVNSITEEETVENLRLKRNYQLSLLGPMGGTISEIVEYLRKSKEELEKEGF